MKIIRGNEVIELTEAELFDAYLEQRNKFDREEVENKIWQIFEDCDDEYIEKIIANKQLIDDTTERFRYYMDENVKSDFVYAAVEDALEYVGYEDYLEEE
jgi:hypothetical protein